mmetsp:Transcript_65685/g.207844  ORF Transcript_65685/g.207844 Transcript_65685/m.207844 type:complete len:208 (-) Transcript_65685:42-665(-)
MAGEELHGGLGDDAPLLAGARDGAVELAVSLPRRRHLRIQHGHCVELHRGRQGRRAQAPKEEGHVALRHRKLHEEVADDRMAGGHRRSLAREHGARPDALDRGAAQRRPHEPAANHPGGAPSPSLARSRGDDLGQVGALHAPLDAPRHGRGLQGPPVLGEAELQGAVPEPTRSHASKPLRLVPPKSHRRAIDQPRCATQRRREQPLS